MQISVGIWVLHAFWSACLIDHASAADIHDNFAWLKGTEWSWNNWRNVVFRSNGVFEAPTPECQAGGCTWSATRSQIQILWGQAGRHTLTGVHRREHHVSFSCLQTLAFCQHSFCCPDALGHPSQLEAIRSCGVSEIEMVRHAMQNLCARSRRTLK